MARLITELTDQPGYGAAQVLENVLSTLNILLVLL